ncbi:hypothetical protein [Saccharibacillus alkalitolerans]|uniref:Thiopeptide-type bacteriocin biosynthesis domain-containing protein n=1 Tax=Saccharibacillus alkalitolerans TaxID=2705290 RepID=A0ABX0F2U2_9BACL|nr:hypothetical protein [Saccharibacillus alkalitolerans]NGZ75307.1 hypothetical protein [Saccharibacillus alkalitolerans]
MPIRIYDYEGSKLPLMLKLAEEVLEVQVPGSYYLDTDWLNGPNILVTLEKAEDEGRLLGPLERCTADYKQERPLDFETVERVKAKYRKEQRRLSDLELRSGADAVMREDGEVRLGEGKTGVYNSEYHLELFRRYRCLLQPVHNKMLAGLGELDEPRRIRMFTDMFLHIATLYNGDAAQGYISYLSHVLGFFSRLKLEGHMENVQERFERLYLNVFAEESDGGREKDGAALDEWKRAWADIDRDMRLSFAKELFEEEDHMDLGEQYRRFERYIAGMDNPFHKRLLERGDLEEMMMSDDMLIYRNLINLFYMTLPLFEQGMAQKHVYGYCAIRRIEESRTGLLMKI